ncbi:MAG: hypothetical protein ACK4RK_01615 [Gemmataceae bacterium]
MKLLASSIGLSVVLVMTGCHQWLHNRHPHNGGQGTASWSHEAPTAASLVGYLQENSRRLNTVDCRSLDVEARQGTQQVGLTGWMVCQKPRDFRMMAKVLGNPAVDVGSNQEEFWYWISRAEPQGLFHCSHQDFATGQAQVNFPFQPEWIVEAMGMGEYGAPEQYQLIPQPKTKTLELVRQTTLPQGQPVRKVTVFSQPTRGQPPQVVAHVLQDAKDGHIICAAYITDYQQERASGAVMPHRLKLVWPAEQVELKLRLDEVTINQPLDPQRSARLFSRPVMPSIPTYDLARLDFTKTSGLRPTGGTYR